MKCRNSPILDVCGCTSLQKKVICLIFNINQTTNIHNRSNYLEKKCYWVSYWVLPTNSVNSYQPTKMDYFLFLFTQIYCMTSADLYRTQVIWTTCMILLWLICVLFLSLNASVSCNYLAQEKSDPHNIQNMSFCVSQRNECEWSLKACSHSNFIFGRWGERCELLVLTQQAKFHPLTTPHSSAIAYI